MESFKNPHLILKIATELSNLVERESEPTVFWREVDQIFNQVIGHQLFTVLRFDQAVGEVVRMYSNRPSEYPVSGAKKMSSTPWGTRVLEQGLPFVGRHEKDIRWAFPDHELLASMSLQSVLNMPVRKNGKTLGTVNMLHREGYYNESHVPVARLLSALLVQRFSSVCKTGLVITHLFKQEQKCIPGR